MNKYITLIEKIKEIIENEPTVKEIYNDENGNFRNVVAPAIMNADDSDILSTTIIMLATQCKAYDILLENISQLGNEELIKKCKNDITKFYMGMVE